MSETNKRADVAGQAELHYDGKVTPLPVLRGSENEQAVDIGKLRGDT